MYHAPLCRTPRMADLVGHAAAKREPSAAAVGPPRQTRKEEALNADVEADHHHHHDEDYDDEHGVKKVPCFKEVPMESGRRPDMSDHHQQQQQQRDVAVLLGDTPSPAPSVISIHSDPTDEEDEDDQRCLLRECVTLQTETCSYPS